MYEGRVFMEMGNLICFYSALYLNVFVLNRVLSVYLNWGNVARELAGEMYL